MWVIAGPFDTEGAVELSSQKSKLLKAGKSYSLGRKNQPLIVLNKKVSALHCTFRVEKNNLDNVYDPVKRPTLTFHNERDKTMRLMRGEEEQTIEPNMILELQDEDVIHIVTGIPISIKWQQVCCYSPSLKGKSNISLETCAQLGVSIVYTSNEHVTHHILPTYVANTSVAASLISAAQFVKFEWLLEILKNEALLEDHFVLPNISKFRPTFSPSLSPSQKVFKVWEPNEERLNIFSEYRFLVFGEKTREIESDLRNLIKRGGGFIETFDVAGGVAKLHKALTRGRAKENQRLVVVADVKDMKAAIGTDEWRKLADEVQSFEFSITYPETVVQSVIDVEPSMLIEYHPSPAATNVLGSSLPDYVLNSIPDEPSIPPEEPLTRKRLVRRTTSRQPSVEPTSQAVPEEGIKVETPKPRRLFLSRRGKTVEPNTNADDPDQTSDAQTTAPIAPTPNRIRLKRRLGGATSASSVPQTGGVQSQLPDIISSVIEEDEPPLKKFKALFDASDPIRSGVIESFDEDIDLDTNVGASQTQSHSGGFVRRAATGTSLSALREEEEEGEDESVVTGGGRGRGRSLARGTKRTLDDVQEEGQDIEMNAVDGDGQPARKRQALDSMRPEANDVAPVSTIQSPTSKRAQKGHNTGAPVGKPDTDAEFLKAVASTKKGKRTEDDFDREFNHLRISKPKAAGQGPQQRVEEDEEWRRFTDFGDDTGLRGNFMVVLEMDVYTKKDKENNSHDSQGTDGSQQRTLPDKWKDQPNFKKFKKKLPPTRLALIELVVSEDHNFDTGPTHWKKSTAKRVGSLSQEIKTEDRPPSLRRGPANAPIDISDNDNDDDKAPPPTLRKRKTAPTQIIQPTKPSLRTGSRAPSTAPRPPGSRENSVIPPTKRTNTKPATNPNSKPALFLDSDDNIEEVDEYEHRSQNTTTSKGGFDEEDEDDQTLRSSTAGLKQSIDTMPERPRVGGRGRRAAAADDDSDDGAVFKGFGMSRRKR